MAVLSFYYNDRLRLGLLSGQYDGVTNPVRRVCDGSIVNRYLAASGTTPTGAYETRISGAFNDAQNPSFLVFPRVTNLSGFRVLVHSEDVDGSNQATRLDTTETVSGESYVYTLSGGVARRVWRITLSGVASLPAAFVYESMLADRYQTTRPLAGVPRARIRQFTRIPLPGTQAFVKRDGPPLRASRPRVVLISGSEVNSLHTFLDTIEGGNPFYYTDDLGQSYYAELMGETQPEQDDAGVYTVEFQVQEIRVD